ncbi:DNA polymerase I, thermostable [Fusobacterium necrophorum subsp. necrophorum]|nr:DNA polymerase I, thermostable [Fusobacterium necrophorum subsp. necrophorum]
MQEAAGVDDRIRGVSFFYGANRTGRYAGRLVQLQNLPRNYLETLDVAREFTRQGNGQALSMLYGNVPDTLSQLIRTAFIPSEGHQFVVSDFSAIEARVIAWLAGEEWRMEVFKTHGKIYEASASQMFGVPLNTIVKGHENYALRAKGKVAELALGYQGSVGALIAMGADKMGLTEHEMKDIVSRWRNTSKRIVELWYALENAAVDVLTTGQKQTVKCVTLAMEFDVTFMQEFLTILLPSGRKLFYPKAAFAREPVWLYADALQRYQSNIKEMGDYTHLWRKTNGKYRTSYCKRLFDRNSTSSEAERVASRVSCAR